MKYKITRLRSNPAKRFTKKAKTKKLRRQWQHVYKSERERGRSKARSIEIASGVVKKSVQRKNPSRSKFYCIEALVLIGTDKRGRKKFRTYWYTGKLFSRDKSLAELYPQYEAKRLARKLLTRVSDKVYALRIMPVNAR